MFLAIAGAACSENEPSLPEPAEIEHWTATPTFVTKGGVHNGDSIFFQDVFLGAFDYDGGVVVRGTENNVVFLDAHGVVSRVVGRRGNGPREFASILAIIPHDGGIVVWDAINRRLTTLRAQEIAFQRPIALPQSHEVIGLLSDGTVVSTFWWLSATGLAAPVPEGSIRQYFLWSEQKDEPLILGGGTEPPPPAVRYDVERDGRMSTVTTQLGSSCLPAWRHAAVGDRILLADSKNGILLSLEESGRKQVLFKHSAVSVTAEVVENVNRMLETRRADGRLPPQAERAFWDRIGEVGEPLPSVWGKMIVDYSEGRRVWLRRASCFDPDSPEVWEILGGQGQLEAIVEMPSRTRLLAVNGKRLLGVITDDLGVESVAVFEAR
jgi:hypothetical protein